MEAIPIWNNQTEITFAFRKKYKSCMLYNRTQGIIYSVCSVLFVIAGLVAYFYAIWCALGLIAISLCLMWAHPILEHAKKMPWAGTLQLSFYEREFTVNGTCYYFSSIRQITFLNNNWILLEVPDRKLLIDGKGFDTCTKEDFFWFMRRNFSAVPIKRRESFIRQYLHVGVTAALCVLSLLVCFVVKGRVPVQEENKDTLLTTQMEGSASTEPVEESMPELPKGHTDFGLFSMELPSGFVLVGDGPKYYKRSENLMILVMTFPKVMYEQSTVEEFAQANSVTAETPDSFSISPAGNPCFIMYYSQQPDFLSNFYCAFFESEYYYIAIFFGSKTVDFETYLPEFQKWEATVNVYKATTGMFYSELKQWDTEQLLLTAPVHMGRGEATNIDYGLAAPDGMTIYTRAYLKSDYRDIPDAEAFRNRFFQQAVDAIYGTGSSGNLYCIYSLSSAERVYSVILENEESFFVVYYAAPAELFDEYLPYFKEWAAETVVK